MHKILNEYGSGMAVDFKAEENKSTQTFGPTRQLLFPLIFGVLFLFQVLIRFRLITDARTLWLITHNVLKPK